MKPPIPLRRRDRPAQRGAHAAALCASLVRRGAIALLLLGLLAGCGAPEDSSGGAAADAAAVDAGSIADTPAAVDRTIRATASGPTTGPRVVFETAVGDDEIVTVRVAVQNFDDLYAIAAHLTWDPASVTLLSAKGHQMMQGAGYGARTLAKAAGQGRLLLGAVRFRDGGSPWAKIAGAMVGDQLWATLQFKLLASEATLRFDPDHSLAKDASYKAIEAGWQQLELRRGAASTSGTASAGKGGA